MVDFDCERLGEGALLLRLGAGIELALNARVHRTCARLRHAGLPGIEDLVPAYASVLVRFDVSVWSAENPDDPTAPLLERVRDVLAAPDGDDGLDQGRLHRLPVCYGGECGEDLEAVAQLLGLAPQTVIERHCASEYRVAMLGFAPGFAYLLGMDAGLEVPRMAHPRTRVPAGSVGIGGAQTGIYPSELPGGWNLIGRTPLTLFDPSDTERPCRLAPGDRVRFESVDMATFEAMRQSEQRR